MNYKVWLCTPEIINDAIIAHSKKTTTPGECSNNFHKTVSCRLGQINIDQVIRSNDEYNRKFNPTPEEINDSYTESFDKKKRKLKIVLAEVFIENFHCHVLDQKDDLKTIDVTKLKLDDYKKPVVYLTKPDSLDNINHESSTITNKFGHVFAVKDMKAINYMGVIEFEIDNENIHCVNCNISSKEESRFYYCHNDKQFFCGKCDEEFHNKPNMKIFAKHKRTSLANFSITHHISCNIHPMKHYDFFCNTCKEVYCSSCIEDDFGHISRHKIDSLEEVKKSIDNHSREVYIYIYIYVMSSWQKEQIK